MPTTATYQYKIDRVDPFINTDDAMASVLAFPVGNSLDLAAGTVVGKVTATGKLAAYASGNADGSQVPIGILQYHTTTDSSGNITNMSQWGVTFTGAPVYTQGAFNIADLTGLDDNAVTKLAGHVDGNGVANASHVFF